MTMAVCHLVRRANGPEPFHTFLESYRRVPAGAEHDLVLLLKGFDRDEADSFRELAPEAEALLLPDVGLDLGSYSAAAHQLHHLRLCFLNSFTRLTIDGWLAKLEAALDDPSTGIAGATGSWGSHWSFLLYELGLPNVYSRAFPSRSAAREASLLISKEREPALSGRALGTAVAAVGALLRLPSFVGRFDPFPSPHLRTNGFLVDRDVMLTWDVGRIEGKWDAFARESGRRSLTHHVEGRGLAAVVVGADGCVFRTDEWPESDTFWQRRQDNLLIADNQTDQYANGVADVRAFLSRFAWGDRAEPDT